MNVFLLLSLACFGILWYTIGTVIVCTYIIRVALPLAKKKKKKEKKLPKTGCQLYLWCVYMDEYSRVALCVMDVSFLCSQPLNYSHGCYFVQKVCITI